MFDQQRLRVRKVYIVTLLVSMSLGVALAFFLVLAFQEHSTPNRLSYYYYFLGKPPLGNFSQVFYIFAAIVPPLTDNLFCQRQGLSKAGQQVETIRRGYFLERSENCSADCTIAELYSPKRWWLILAVFYAVLAIASLALMLLLPTSKENFTGLILMAGFCALAAILCGFWSRKNNLLARIDAQGVQAKDTRSLQNKIIAWSAIHRCEITMTYGVLGDIIRANFVFNGEDGNSLLCLMTIGVSDAQIRAFKAAIEQHLSA